MGCNFYTLSKKHIGKRSAAGMYCWDCKVTLCEEGEERAHYDQSGWHDKCPKCGNIPLKEDLNESAVGIELGFNKKKIGNKKGVKLCSSFSWAIDFSKCKAKVVVDEYGKKYTREEFLKMMKSIPIQYTNMMNTMFF